MHLSAILSGGNELRGGRSGVPHEVVDRDVWGKGQSINCPFVMREIGSPLCMEGHMGRSYSLLIVFIGKVIELTMSSMDAFKVVTLTSFINSLWLTDAIWHWEILVYASYGSGLMHDGTKPLSEPMLTDHQWGLVVFTVTFFRRVFGNECVIYSSYSLRIRPTKLSTLSSILMDCKHDLQNHLLDQRYFC